MNQKIILFIFLVALFLFLKIILEFLKKDTKYLPLSFIISCVPFQIAFPVFTPNYISGAGSFNDKIYITIPLVACIVMALFIKIKTLKYNFENENWVIGVGVLISISLLNPNNHAPISTIAFALLFLTYILFCRLIAKTLKPDIVVKGVFASFFFLCVLQVLLAICFPLLGIIAVTDMFQVGGSEWATRMGTRPGAIGVFTHPANLGLFTTIASGFFLSCGLSGYKTKISFILVALNTVTIILTYSRTSYVTYVVILCVIFYIFKNAKKRILSFKTLFLGVLPLTCILGWLIFLSPLSANFLNSDANEMFQARMDHWLIGLDIFNNFRLFGVGINAHIEYISQNPAMLASIHNEFLSSNPIHDIYIIILAETGIVGFMCWMFFLGASISKAKRNIANNNNIIFSLTQIGLIMAFCVYGVTDWSPFSQSIFPLFIVLTFFANKYAIPETFNAKNVTLVRV